MLTLSPGTLADLERLLRRYQRTLYTLARRPLPGPGSPGCTTRAKLQAARRRTRALRAGWRRELRTIERELTAILSQHVSLDTASPTASRRSAHV